jgi:glycosyltransferase involved in cell wall biosynthesis
MKGDFIHIVDLDVPYPANYGAAIDMYFRIKSLHALGIKIILHCFEYGRGKASRLNNYCEQVHYYPRKSILEFPFRSEPYIVYSRENKELFDRLFADNHPVLLEGVHTCASLMDKRYKQKKFYVRMHNVESEYYEYLAKATQQPFKRYYYKTESERLKKFEKNLDHAQALFSVSERDHATLSSQFPKVEYLPPFIYNDTIDCKPGRGSYAIYHGNLGVEENRKAAEFLINDVFPGLNVPLLIVGTNANTLSKTTKVHNIEFINSPTANDLKDLLQNAQIHVLPTFQPTGIKHKLLNSLFSGRYCVVNPPMVEANGLAQFCYIAKDAAEMKKMVQELFKKDFPQEEIDRRMATLQNIYSNSKNGEKLVNIIFGKE